MSLLTKFLFLVLAVTTLKTRRSEPRKKRNHDASPRSHHHEPAGKSEINRATINPVTIQPDSDKQQWRQDQKRIWERQIRVAKILNGITAFAAAVGLLSLWFVWQALESTRTQALTAKRAVDVAEETFRLDQRAWLGVKEMTFRGDVKPGSPLFAAIQVENSGKTPALEVGIMHTLTFAEPSKDRLTVLPKVGNFGKISIAPGAMYIAIQMFSTRLTASEIEKLNTTKPYVFGRISYKDIFFREHETWFCSFYGRDFFPALHFCETLNNMD